LSKFIIIINIKNIIICIIINIASIKNIIICIINFIVFIIINIINIINIIKFAINFIAIEKNIDVISRVKSIIFIIINLGLKGHARPKLIV
jgi:hypothetical protein